MSLRQKLGTPDDIPFPPIMIGAGLNKNFNDPLTMRKYSEAAAEAGGAVVVGSITRHPRPGNRGTLLEFEINGVTVNTWGMPNQGVDSMPWPAPHDNLIVSIAGDTVEDYIYLYDKLWKWGLGVEFNFGCPNTGSGNRITSFLPEVMEAVLQHIQYSRSKQTVEELRQLVGLKLSPYSDPFVLSEVADMISKFDGTVDYVATCNTFPNGRVFDPSTGKLAINNQSTDDMGGVGGRALNEICLGQARQFRKRFDRNGVDIAVVRVGGVSDGIDLWVSQQERIDAVQVVSAASFHTLYRMMTEYEAMDYAYPSKDH